MIEITDEQLIEKYLKGDEISLEILMASSLALISQGQDKEGIELEEPEQSEAGLFRARLFRKMAKA